MRGPGPFAAVATLVVLLAASVPSGAAASAPLKFGMDHGSIAAQSSLGAKPDYAAFWAGVWNEASGWSHLGTWADRAADQGVTPVVHWWYWGDDISRSCVSNGCWSDLHDRWKSRANWRSDALRLADALHAGLNGRAGVVVVESEFNKGDVAGWETFDGYLAEHARIFRDRAPELRLTLGFGNWGQDQWKVFDRAAGAMDSVGFQTMRGSTRDSADRYLGAVDAIQTATARLRSTFGKPVLLTDLALSSYPDATWSARQEDVVQELFARRGELKAAGLVGVIYRGLRDDPTMDPANYYGRAEQHWGLRRADGSSKPALDDWVRGVKAERGGDTTVPGSPGSPEPFLVTFTPRGVGNDWWVEVKLDATKAVAKAEGRLDGGAWKPLAKTSWGTYAASLHAPDGTKVQFRASSFGGTAVTSATTTW